MRGGCSRLPSSRASLPAAHRGLRCRPDPQLHPAQTHRPPLPRDDVPGGGLTPPQLLRAYNATPLVREGFTGRGETVLVFGFDGFRQQDMDIYADTFGLPRFTPEVIGGMPERVRGIQHGSAGDPRDRAGREAGPGQRPFHHEQRRRWGLREAGPADGGDDRPLPGAVWSFSIGWGCDRLFTAADFALVRAALAGALRTGTTAFNATGDLAAWNAKADSGGRPALAGRRRRRRGRLAAGDGRGRRNQAVHRRRGRLAGRAGLVQRPTHPGHGRGASTLFGRPAWQTVGLGSELPDRRLVPDISAVSDPFTGVRIVFQQQQAVGGGTSQAAPILAGLATLMNQKLAAVGAEPLGDLNPCCIGWRRPEAARVPRRELRRERGRPVRHRRVRHGHRPGHPNVENLVKDILLVRAGA